MPLERLQKIISRSGIASRRHAEELILAGQVRVNGEVVNELGAKADPETDRVEVAGQVAEAPSEPAYYLLNKPAHVVSTMSDPEGRATLRHLLRGLSGGVYPVGRLDYDASGLMLLTTDGELANRLFKSSSRMAQVFWIKIKGRPTKELLAKIHHSARARLRLLAAPSAAAKDAANPWYEVEMGETRRDLLRTALFAADHPVEKMRRVKLGPLELGTLPEAEYRALEPAEVARLRQAVERAEQTPVFVPKGSSSNQPPSNRRPGRRNAAPGNGALNRIAAASNAGNDESDQSEPGNRAADSGDRQPFQPSFKPAFKPSYKPAFKPGFKSSSKPRSDSAPGHHTSSHSGPRPSFKPRPPSRPASYSRSDRPGNFRPSSDRPNNFRQGSDRPNNFRQGSDRPNNFRQGSDRPNNFRPSPDRPANPWSANGPTKRPFGGPGGKPFNRPGGKPFAGKPFNKPQRPFDDEGNPRTFQRPPENAFNRPGNKPFQRSDAPQGGRPQRPFENRGGERPYGRPSGKPFNKTGGSSFNRPDRPQGPRPSRPFENRGGDRPYGRPSGKPFNKTGGSSFNRPDRPQGPRPSRPFDNRGGDRPYGRPSGKPFNKTGGSSFNRPDRPQGGRPDRPFDNKGGDRPFRPSGSKPFQRTGGKSFGKPVGKTFNRPPNRKPFVKPERKDSDE